MVCRFSLDPGLGVLGGRRVARLAGGRNSTPGLNGIQEISGSAIAAVAYPVPYALTAALMLILGYIAMVFS